MTSRELRPLAVLDVDGVLADVRHRLHHLQGRPRDWEAFFAAAAADPLLPEGLALARTAAEDCDLLYLSGRPARLTVPTRDWLARHGLPEGDLVLRPEGDRRPARVLKPALLAQHAAGRVVAVVVDDDAEVVRALVRAGHRVLHATWAQDAAPGLGGGAALRDAQDRQGRT